MMHITYEKNISWLSPTTRTHRRGDGQSIAPFDTAPRHCTMVWGVVFLFLGYTNLDVKNRIWWRIRDAWNVTAVESHRYAIVRRGGISPHGVIVSQRSLDGHLSNLHIRRLGQLALLQAWTEVGCRCELLKFVRIRTTCGMQTN